MSAVALFEPARHEALSGSAGGAWRDDRALEVIRTIVDGVVRDRLPEGHWPVHPLDAEGETPRTGFKTLYLGSAGVLWAVDHLRRHGAIDSPSGLDVAAGIEQALSSYLADPDTGEVVPSYFLGEAGLQLVRWRLTGSAEAAERLFAAVQSNIPNPTNEALWAAPGTMVAALHLW